MPGQRDHEKREHYRGKTRPDRQVELHYRRHLTDGGRRGPAILASTRNIGVGGAYILTLEPCPVGTELTIAVHVPATDERLEVEAVVRWTMSGEQQTGQAGMGVKFMNLDVDSLLSLSEYFASLTTGGDD